MDCARGSPTAQPGAEQTAWGDDGLEHGRDIGERRALPVFRGPKAARASSRRFQDAGPSQLSEDLGEIPRRCVDRPGDFRQANSARLLPRYIERRPKGVFDRMRKHVVTGLAWDAITMSKSEIR